MPQEAVETKKEDELIIPLPENEAGKKKEDDEYTNKMRVEFLKDVEHRRTQHKKNNYHYLQYKGILWLNNVYGEEYLRSVGLQVFVPRTFMTIESIRPYLSGQPLDIKVSSETKRKFPAARKAEDFLKSQWRRSKADWQKANAEFYAMLFGTGFLLSRYVDDYDMLPMYDGMDDKGVIKWKEGRFQRYRGMKLQSLNPYHVFPDRDATSDASMKRCFLYSIWDFETWKEHCENMDFTTEGMAKGGHLEEFDAIRRKIDTIYGATNVDLRTRDNGTLVSNIQLEHTQMDFENKIMVVECFTEKEYSVMSGANWTLNYKGINPDPDKIISIKTVKDYEVPDEFDGIGEPEVIRWQQYEENKVHNLAYMATLMATVQRYGILESALVDPTEASFSNPLKWIKLKNAPGADINKAIMQLNQKSSNDVPLKFLEKIDQIRQETSGISTYITASPESSVDTLGEADMMRVAGLERIRQKIYSIEERDIVPLLEHWMCCIPQYYTDELDLLMNSRQDDFYVKYLPFDREFNNDIPTVADLSTKEGISGAMTIEEVYLKAGYQDVIFASDLVGEFLFTIKTATAASDRDKILKQLTLALDALIKVNEAVGYPAYNLVDFGEEIIRQFPEVIKDIDSIKNPAPPPQPGVPGQAPGAPAAPGPGGAPALPGAQTHNGQPNGLPDATVAAASAPTAPPSPGAQAMATQPPPVPAGVPQT